MRLFVALVPPPEAVADLAAAVGAVREQHPALRWVPPERWHLTLAFYGEVPEQRVADLGRRVERAAGRSPAARLQLAGAGRFGSQVLWAGVAGDVDVVSRLAASAGAAGRRVGADVEDRPYRPHLTLARTRRPAGGAARGAGRGPDADLRPAVAALAGHRGREWTASAVRLVRSHLGPEPSYEVLLTAPLG